jgi:hypothetical protein
MTLGSKLNVKHHIWTKLNAAMMCVLITVVVVCDCDLVATGEKKKEIPHLKHHGAELESGLHPD